MPKNETTFKDFLIFLREFIYFILGLATVFFLLKLGMTIPLIGIIVGFALVTLGGFCLAELYSKVFNGLFRKIFGKGKNA